MKNPFAFLFRRRTPGTPPVAPASAPAAESPGPEWAHLLQVALSHLETEMEILERLDEIQPEISTALEKCMEASGRAFTEAQISQVSTRAAALLIGGQLDFLRRANRVALAAIEPHRPKSAARLANAEGPYRVAFNARRILRQILAEHASE